MSWPFLCPNHFALSIWILVWSCDQSSATNWFDWSSLACVLVVSYGSYHPISAIWSWCLGWRSAAQTSHYTSHSHVCLAFRPSRGPVTSSCCASHSVTGLYHDGCAWGLQLKDGRSCSHDSHQTLPRSNWAALSQLALLDASEVAAVSMAQLARVSMQAFSAASWRSLVRPSRAPLASSSLSRYACLRPPPYWQEGHPLFAALRSYYWS